MAAPKPCFEVVVLDRGFYVNVKEPKANPKTGDVELDLTKRVALATPGEVGTALWDFLRPYSVTITVEGALPESPE